MLMRTPDKSSQRRLSHRATHEFIVILRGETREPGVNAMDFAKRLLDYGVHAETACFALPVPESLLIEATETEPEEVLDSFVDAMKSISTEALADPAPVKGAPHTLPLGRRDNVPAEHNLDLAWRPDNG